MTTESHRTYPCGQCPWRIDADQSAFGEADMGKLARANGVRGAVAGVDAPTMACHLDQPGTSSPMRLCAGWLAVVGPHHLRIRLDVLAGRLPGDAVVPGADWPALYRSLDELFAERVRRLA